MTREIIENSNNGRVIEYDYTENFPRIYNDFKNEIGFKVFKTHSLSPIMKELIFKKEALGIYCYRDIRDVIVSAEHKRVGNVNPKNDYSDFAKNYINYFNEVTELPNVHIAKYELFYDNIEKEVNDIMLFLDISLSKDEIINISERLHFKKSKKYINEIDKEEFIGKNGKKFLLDKKTMLHHNHFRHIVPGAYKKYLSKINLNSIESVSYNWLIENDYSLDLVSHLRYKIKKWIK
jgi:hypothetical protein